MLVSRELHVKATPCPTVVSAGEPKPVQSEREAGALDVLDTKAAEGEGAADTLPVNVTVSSVGGGATSPEKPTFNLLDHLKGFLWWGECK
jgi:hypothetical protein